jgi:hypothetical protein
MMAPVKAITAIRWGLVFALLRVSRVALMLVPLVYASMVSIYAATWYVDGSVPSNGDGKSWSTAWADLANAKGIAPGDVVYISGGPSGRSQTYNEPNGWTPTAGKPGSIVTYQIGQDAQHNGTAIFDTGKNAWCGLASYTLISGNAGGGKQHFQINTTTTGACIYANSPTVHAQVSYISVPQMSGSFYYSNGGGPGLDVDNC